MSVWQAPPALEELEVQIFFDGADLREISHFADDPRINGFTTNPALMWTAGVAGYKDFAVEVVRLAGDRPVSFEVVSNDLVEIERQAHLIAGWGDHVYVKVPVTTGMGEPTAELQRRLAKDGVRVNATAAMTVDHVTSAVDALAGGPPCIVSVFAGRVSDTGRDPLPLMRAAKEEMASASNCRLLWASVRQVYDLFLADRVGCDIVTLTSDLLMKLSFIGCDLDQLAQQTVGRFEDAAANAGYDV